MAIPETLGTILLGLAVSLVVVYILYATPQLIRDRFRAGKRAARDPEEE